MMTCDNPNCATTADVEKHEISMKGRRLSYMIPDIDLCDTCAQLLCHAILSAMGKLRKGELKEDD